MKREMFEELLGSVREAGAILGGQKASRRIVIGSSTGRAIRERTRLSQSEFADLNGVRMKTLQNWEQDRAVRRNSQRPLEIISHESQLTVKAIHQL